MPLYILWGRGIIFAEDSMRIHRGFGEAVSIAVDILLWVLPTGGTIAGGVVCGLDFRYGAPSEGEALKFIGGIFIGFICGVIADFVMLGPLVVLLNIQDDLAAIRDKLCPAETK
jgi:hypothetical protein